MHCRCSSSSLVLLAAALAAIAVRPAHAVRERLHLDAVDAAELRSAAASSAVSSARAERAKHKAADAVHPVLHIDKAIKAAVWVTSHSAQLGEKTVEVGNDWSGGNPHATWARFETEMAKSDFQAKGTTDWDKLKEQTDYSSRDVEEVVREPELAHAMTEALLGVLLKRSEIQAQCESSWLGYAAHYAAYPFSTETQAQIDQSISVVKTEVVDAIAESVEGLERSANIILMEMLQETCRLLTHSIFFYQKESLPQELPKCNVKNPDALLLHVQLLENKAVGYDKGLSYQIVPIMDQMHMIIFQTYDTMHATKRIADFAAVLLGINLGAAHVENAALRGDLSNIRDKVWACGQPTFADTRCSAPSLIVRVPATLSGEERYVTQVFGSRFITALLLYYSDAEAYPEDVDRSYANPASWVGYGKSENPNRRGFPGGLGAQLGETDQVKLKQRLLYWDPATSIGEWMGEMCAHAKLRSGSHDCNELSNMFMDVTSAVMMATAVQGVVSFVGGIGVSAKAMAVGTALVMKAGGAGAGVSAAVKLALASAGIPGAAPVVLVTLATATLIGGAVWLVWRLRNTGVENLSSEDCLCGLLSTVTRPDGNHEGAIIPTAERVGAGHHLCTSGLGSCPTHSVMKARQDWDTLFVSFEEVAKKQNCHLIAECSLAAADAFCKLEKNLMMTKKMCFEKSDCNGHFKYSGAAAGDGQTVFKRLCTEFEQDKMGTRMQQVRDMAKAAKLETVCKM